MSTTQINQNLIQINRYRFVDAFLDKAIRSAGG